MQKANEADLAELIANTIEDAELCLVHDIIFVDWNDLGELTVVTDNGTFRATFIKLSEE